MDKIAFFDTKSYDIESFSKYKGTDFKFRFLSDNLNPSTAELANGCTAVCAFVNDDLGTEVIEKLYEMGVRVILMRCSGYNNVDLNAAKGKMKILRVPAYSPHAVAEHAMAMLLMLNRRLHRSYIRTRDHNFSLEGLTGFDLFGKTVGIVGTGKIGCCFADICNGFGMEILGYDPYENEHFNGKYVTADELFRKSDIISLHCPLTKENQHFIDADSIEKMKNGVFIINTSRGKLIDARALRRGLKSGKIGAAGLDVYEEESDLFFEDFSDEIIRDDLLVSLLSMPNVVISAHQAFLTREALDEIARVTVDNMQCFIKGEECRNEVK